MRDPEALAAAQPRVFVPLLPMLAEIAAAEAPRLLVWNKIDAAGIEPGAERDQYGRISRVFVSARTGAGLAELRGAIAEAARSGAPQREAPATQALSL